MISLHWNVYGVDKSVHIGPEISNVCQLLETKSCHIVYMLPDRFSIICDQEACCPVWGGPPFASSFFSHR